MNTNTQGGKISVKPGDSVRIKISAKIGKISPDSVIKLGAIQSGKQWFATKFQYGSYIVLSTKVNPLVLYLYFFILSISSF